MVAIVQLLDIKSVKNDRNILKMASPPRLTGKKVPYSALLVALLVRTARHICSNHHCVSETSAPMSLGELIRGGEEGGGVVMFEPHLRTIQMIHVGCLCSEYWVCTRVGAH